MNSEKRIDEAQVSLVGGILSDVDTGDFDSDFGGANSASRADTLRVCSRQHLVPRRKLRHPIRQ